MLHCCLLWLQHGILLSNVQNLLSQSCVEDLAFDLMGLETTNVFFLVQIAKTLNEVISKYCQVVLDTMAYAGTGNVLKVQELLALCGEHIETDANSSWKVGLCA